jgi:ribosomal protein L40E
VGHQDNVSYGFSGGTSGFSGSPGIKGFQGHVDSTESITPHNYSCDNLIGSSLDHCFTRDQSVGLGASTPKAELHVQSDRGATVEGRHSGQSFSETTIGVLESDFTEISLTIKPAKSSVTVKKTRFKFCFRCGKKNTYAANFCDKCGEKI